MPDDVNSNMSEPISYHCILAAALVALSLVSNVQAASHLTFEQLAEGQPPETGIQAASGENNSDPGSNASNPEGDASSGKAPSVADTSGVSDCGSLESAAATQGLPIDFFTRLIRQESNFDPKAVSRRGAQGIAQFMPGTARWRGLADPFKPAEALKNQRAGFVNSAANSEIWVWRQRHTMQAHSASETGSPAVASFPMKRGLTSES